MILKKWPSENIMGKGENTNKQHFLLFTMRFLFFHTKILSQGAYMNVALKCFPYWAALKYCCVEQNITKVLQLKYLYQVTLHLVQLGSVFHQTVSLDNQQHQLVWLEHLPSHSALLLYFSK